MIQPDPLQVDFMIDKFRVGHSRRAFIFLLAYFEKNPTISIKELRAGIGIGSYAHTYQIMDLFIVAGLTQKHIKEGQRRHRYTKIDELLWERIAQSLDGVRHGE